MSRGKTLIRIRSRQEQMRRRLLMLGIPLFAAGCTLIWTLNRPATVDEPAPELATTATTVPVAEEAATLPSEPTSLPEEPATTAAVPQPEPTSIPNAVIAQEQPTTPMSLTDAPAAIPESPSSAGTGNNSIMPTHQPAENNVTASATSTTTSAPTNTTPIAADQAVVASPAPLPLVTASTTTVLPSATAANTLAPAPIAANVTASSDKLVEPSYYEVEKPPIVTATAPTDTSAAISNTTKPDNEVTASTTPNTGSDVTNNETVFTLVNEKTPSVTSVTSDKNTTNTTSAKLPSQTAPTVVIHASTRTDTNIAASTSRATTLLAFSDQTPLNTEPTPPAVSASTRQDTPAMTRPLTEPTRAPQGNTGWIYAGQYNNGNWVQRGLMIDNQLPIQGQRYQLAAGANLRNAPPGGGGGRLGETIGVINQGNSIQVVRVKKSGNSGHIWLEVRH